MEVTFKRSAILPSPVPLTPPVLSRPSPALRAGVGAAHPNCPQGPKVNPSAHLEALGLSAPGTVSCPGLSPPWSLGGSLAHISIPVPLCFAVGLDAAGKTTILYKLKLGEIVTTIPTIGE